MIDGTALAIRKEVLSVFGLLAPTCPTEDSTLRFRCLLLKGIVYVGKPGIYYRIHSSSMSSFNNIFKLNVVNIAEQYEKDVSIAYKYGYINAAFLKKVLLKIAWYKSNRILAEKIYKKPNDIWARIKIGGAGGWAPEKSVAQTPCRALNFFFSQRPGATFCFGGQGPARVAAGG